MMIRCFTIVACSLHVHVANFHMTCTIYICTLVHIIILAHPAWIIQGYFIYYVNDIIAVVSKAYTVLVDSTKRREYDSERHENFSGRGDEPQAPFYTQEELNELLRNLFAQGASWREGIEQSCSILLPNEWVTMTHLGGGLNYLQFFYELE